MKQKIIVSGLTILTAFFMFGCSNQTLAEYQQQNEQVQTEVLPEGETENVDTMAADADTVAAEEPAKVLVDIFYSNADATGFDSKQVEMERVTPENLIQELAKVNVVSYDTEVLSFIQTGKRLSLDLSNDFSNYLNMMGSSGEYIVIGSLVNSFLSYYDADDILITVNGKELATSHAIYDKPLTMFENGDVSSDNADGKKEAMAYRLMDTSFIQEEKTVYYPQFDGMPDEKLQDLWNQAIEEIAIGSFLQEETKTYEKYAVDYTVGYCSTEKISFKFKKTTTLDGASHTEFYALSFDLVEGTCIRFASLPDTMETVSYNLANQGYYKVSGKDVDRETFDEYYKQVITDAGDFREMFLHYDFDITDRTVKPEGYIFINGEGELEILMNPVEALSDEQITIQTGIKLK